MTNTHETNSLSLSLSLSLSYHHPTRITTPKSSSLFFFSSLLSMTISLHVRYYAYSPLDVTLIISLRLLLLIEENEHDTVHCIPPQFIMSSTTVKAICVCVPIGRAVVQFFFQKASHAHTSMEYNALMFFYVTFSTTKEGGKKHMYIYRYLEHYTYVSNARTHDKNKTKTLKQFDVVVIQFFLF